MAFFPPTYSRAGCVSLFAKLDIGSLPFAFECYFCGMCADRPLARTGLRVGVAHFDVGSGQSIPKAQVTPNTKRLPVSSSSATTRCRSSCDDGNRLAAASTACYTLISHFNLCRVFELFRDLRS